MSDYSLTNGGSLYLLTPNSQRARKNLQRNTSSEAQWWAGALVVEPRYIRDLASKLVGEGWSVA